MNMARPAIGSCQNRREARTARHTGEGVAARRSISRPAGGSPVAEPGGVWRIHAVRYKLASSSSSRIFGERRRYTSHEPKTTVRLETKEARIAKDSWGLGR